MCIALEQKQTKSNPKNLMLTFHNHENKTRHDKSFSRNRSGTVFLKLELKKKSKYLIG